MGLSDAVSDTIERMPDGVEKGKQEQKDVDEKEIRRKPALYNHYSRVEHRWMLYIRLLVRTR